MNDYVSIAEPYNDIHVGVLAVQGDFAEHLYILQSMGVGCSQVRTVGQLEDCTHLVVPGGESTVMSRFLSQEGLGDMIKHRVEEGSLSILATCAGTILLAKQIEHSSEVDSLAVLDITIDRNAYGSQMQSFETSIRIEGYDRSIDASFIRAPIITEVGDGVEVLAMHDEHSVLVRQGNILAATFHPEVHGETVIHELFLQM